MDFLDALQISASGLNCQRQRMNIVSSNLANSETTRTQEGGPYKRKEIVFSSQPVKETFGDIFESQAESKMSEVKVVGVIDDPRPPIRKYEPQHPDADEKGYVSLPNINLVEEMVNMMSAARSYEANATAINTTKKMALKALEIGR